MLLSYKLSKTFILSFLSCEKTIESIVTNTSLNKEEKKVKQSKKKNKVIEEKKQKKVNCFWIRAKFIYNSIYILIKY
jgi:hypothetical protein